MEWYLEHTHGGRWIIRCSGAWGGMAVLPALYRDELPARMRAAELNRSYLPVLPSFDFECQRERDLMEWAVSKYGWREEGEFTPEGFRDQEHYHEDLFSLRFIGSPFQESSKLAESDRDRLLEQFASYLESKSETQLTQP